MTVFLLVILGIAFIVTITMYLILLMGFTEKELDILLKEIQDK